jgi:hypothetical protein
MDSTQSPVNVNVRSESTLPTRGRQLKLKQAPRLAIDAGAKENGEMVSNVGLVVKSESKASWNRGTTHVLQHGWIPAKIRQMGTGRVALLQPLTDDELAARRRRRSRKKHVQLEPENTNSNGNTDKDNWRGMVIATHTKNPSSPALSALTTDSEANPKICPLRIFRRRRTTEK